jgi:thioredoxin 1
MNFVSQYSTREPSRHEVDALPGLVLLEFGNTWCGYCRRAEPLVADALRDHPSIRHIKIADASGRRLGRSFGVKLWPTLIFLQDGDEVARFVRPVDANGMRGVVKAIAG